MDSNFNTWMGDPIRVMIFNKTIDMCQDPNVLENVRITGKFLLGGLQLLAKLHSNVLSNARGIGTFCAMDFDSPDHRNQFVAAIKKRGVNIGGCGDLSIRFRPTLSFTPKHAAMFLRIAEETLCALFPK